MAAVAKDPAIKLFGRTISLTDTHFSDDSESLDNGSSMLTKADTRECRNGNSGTIEEAASVEQSKVEQTQTSLQKPSQAMLKPRDHQDESDSTEELKSCKRPDKIVPCPRCNSLDTKFCYFNNYNVNQPRHFCKSCQRYWTAGGTVRNVPVGAGRRRNKQLACQYRQIVSSSDGGPITVVETVDSANQLLSCEESASSCTVSTSNEMVLKFGPESPLCDSTQNMATQGQRNGCSRMDLRSGEFYDTGSLSCAPSTASSSELRGINNDLSLQQPLYHCTLPPPITAVVPDLNGSAPLALSGCASRNISLQFVPTSYFNCIPIWVAGSGNISLAVQNGCVPSQFLSSGNGLQVLGKHPRDVDVAGDTGMNTPPSKTLRIRDLDEA